MSEEEKKEGILKRLENIKDTNLTSLQVIKDQGEKQLKKLKNIKKTKTLKVIHEIERKNDEANKILFNIKKVNKELSTPALVCTKTDGTKYDFNTFMLPLEFVEEINNCEITLDEAKDNQDKLEKRMNRLENYKAKKQSKIEEKKRVLESAVKLFCVREDIINFFEKEIFPFKGNVFKTKEEEIKEKTKEEKTKEFINNVISFIEKKIRRHSQ